MKLRFATRADLAAMIELGRGIHAESRFAAMPYDPGKLATALENVIVQQSRGSQCFLVVENREGHIIGGLIGALEEYFFTRAQSANTILIWVDPAYRGTAAALRLINSFREWAVKHRAHEVCVLIASGVSIVRTDRFLRRLGFAQTGGNYTMKLSPHTAPASQNKEKNSIQKEVTYVTQ